MEAGTARDFKAKAKRYEEMLMRRAELRAEGVEVGVGDGRTRRPTATGANDLPVGWQEAIAEVRGSSSAGEGAAEAEAEAEAAPSPAPAAPAVPGMVALMALKADATSGDASFAEAVIDRTVQFGQPYPAVTHVELWIGDRPAERGEDNHFSTYLGARKGALWTSGLTDSKKFYSSAAWSAIPIFAPNAERRARAECNLHCGTPYPSAAVLWQYPMSIWPLRAFSGFLDDRINAPAHCAALTARILRSAVPEVSLMRPSHWYGPSALYLEMSTPERMERALAMQRPVVRSQVEEEHDERLGDILTLHSDDEVVAMSTSDARQAVHALAIAVLRAGSRTNGADPDQGTKRAAEERFARGLTRYTWLNRKENQR